MHPPTLEQVDGWLSRALRRSGVRALEAHAFPEGAGQLSTVFRLRFVPAPVGDLPATMILKSESGSATAREIADQLGTSARERAFYERIAPLLPGAPAPRCHAIVADSDGTTRFLLEDLGALRLPPTGRTLAFGDLLAVLSRIGEIHGRTWGRTELEGLPSPRTLAWMPERYRAAEPLFLQHFGDVLPAGGRAWVGRIGACFEAVIEAVASIAAEVGDCACHGDLRAANLAFESDGTARLFDWGMTLRAPGPFELGYLLPTALPPHRLRGREAELLAHYARAMEHAGGPRLPEAILRRCVDLGRLWFTIYVVVGAATTPIDNPASQRFFRWHARRQFTSLPDLDALLAST